MEDSSGLNFVFEHGAFEDDADDEQDAMLMEKYIFFKTYIEK